MDSRWVKSGEYGEHVPHGGGGGGGRTVIRQTIVCVGGAGGGGEPPGDGGWVHETDYSVHTCAGCM
jgi:hypothetical protein